jgi:hypothetical protein
LRQVAPVENTWFFLATRDMEKAALFERFLCDFNVTMPKSAAAFDSAMRRFESSRPRLPVQSPDAPSKLS